MSYENAFDTVKDFFENKPASTKAMAKLNSGAEISLRLDDKLECALFNSKGKATVEQRPANRPDVEFVIRPEALRILENHPGDQMAKFGIDVLKQVMAGQVEIKVVGSAMGILRGGYLKIILEAGPEFTGFLAANGIKNIGKITAIIKSLKR